MVAENLETGVSEAGNYRVKFFEHNVGNFRVPMTSEYGNGPAYKKDAEDRTR